MDRSQYGEITQDAQRSVGFYLADNFSLLPFASAIEPLRIANRLSKKALYQWAVVTDDGEAVHATNGMLVQAQYSVKDAPQFSMLFVSGPHDPSEFNHQPTLNWLSKQGKDRAGKNISGNEKSVIGGIETGAIILAEAGLLDGVQCTTHWENLSEFRQKFPRHKISSDLYEIDGYRVTCSGGSASMDMMLYIIERQHDHELAASVSDVMIHPHIRHSGEPQRMNIEDRIGINHPILVDCVELMEANVEQPLSPQELSNLVGVSKRQLERLFRRYLNTTPARYYLTIRLSAARDLLEKSSAKIIDVAIACGFKSAGHFSSRYVSSFGETPRETRNT